MQTTLPFLPFVLPEIGEDEIVEVVDTLRSGNWSTDAYLLAPAVANQRRLVTFRSRHFRRRGARRRQEQPDDPELSPVQRNATRSPEAASAYIGQKLPIG
jgi:hypothetical protein